MIWLAVTTIKMSAVVGIGLIAAAVVRRRSAALRHWLIAAALMSAALVPVVALVGPTWTTPVTSSVASVSGQPPTLAVDLSNDAPAGDAQPPLRPRQFAPERAARWVMALWLIGASIDLLALGLSMRRLRRAARQMPSIDGATWTAGLERVARILGVRSEVALLASAEPALLVTWGFVSPKIALPRGAAVWSPARVQVVLSHELAHVARGDWLVQVAAEVLRCVFWFNPVLWLACLRLRHESERACDDMVLTAGVDGAVYATELLELARLFGVARRSWFPAPAMTGRPSGLERRITAMFDTRLRRAPLTRAARYGLVAGFAALTLPLAAFAQGSFGSLSGTVTDQMKRVLPDVTVTVVDEQHNASHVVHTDGDGHFQLLGLVPGTYRLETALPGFQPQSATMNVNGDAVQRDLTLEVGNLQETMTVTSASGPARVTAGAPPRATQPCSDASSIGGNIRAPRKTRDARPAYAGVDGVVKLAAVIATDGSITDVRVVKSDSPALEAPAVDAVSQWQFDATLLNCVPVPVTMNVAILFHQ